MPLSFWEREAFTQCNVLIVGGGLVGLSTACSLLERNPKLNVTLIERGTLPTGASTKNAGFACFGSLTELLSDSKSLSPDEVVSLVELRWRGLNRLRERLGDDTIQFQCKGGFELITEKELFALDRLDEINRLLIPVFGQSIFAEKPELKNQFGWKNSSTIKTVVEHKLEGSLNPVFAVDALKRRALQLGLEYLTASVKSYKECNSGVETHISITSGESLIIKSDKIVICTNAFASELLPKEAPLPGRGQVVITKPLGTEVPFSGVFHYDEGYYYFRDVGNRVLLGGGRNLDVKGETTTSFEQSNLIQTKLKELLANVILPNTEFEIDMAWSGIMGFRQNRFPEIRKHGNYCLSAVGLGGMGVAVSSAIADELADRII